MIGGGGEKVTFVMWGVDGGHLCFGVGEFIL